MEAAESTSCSSATSLLWKNCPPAPTPPATFNQLFVQDKPSLLGQGKAAAAQFPSESLCQKSFFQSKMVSASELISCILTHALKKKTNTKPHKTKTHIITPKLTTNEPRISDFRRHDFRLQELYLFLLQIFSCVCIFQSKLLVSPSFLTCACIKLTTKAILKNYVKHEHK